MASGRIHISSALAPIITHYQDSLLTLFRFKPRLSLQENPRSSLFNNNLSLVKMYVQILFPIATHQEQLTSRQMTFLSWVGFKHECSDRSSGSSPGSDMCPAHTYTCVTTFTTQAHTHTHTPETHLNSASSYLTFGCWYSVLQLYPL